MDAIKWQTQKLHRILLRLDMVEQKKELVLAFTNGRTDSSTEMTYGECQDLINTLAPATKHTPGKPIYEADPVEKLVLDRMRKKMLGLGYTMGYDQPTNSQQHGLKPSTINYQNVDTWCRSKHSTAKKGLNEMTRKELAAAITQFEKIGSKFLQEL